MQNIPKPLAARCSLLEAKYHGSLAGRLKRCLPAGCVTGLLAVVGRLAAIGGRLEAAWAGVAAGWVAVAD